MPTQADDRSAGAAGSRPETERGAAGSARGAISSAGAAEASAREAAASAPGPAFSVRVDAPARLQMGLLDLRGDLGRLFGGLGAAVREPRTVVEVEPGGAMRAVGPDSERSAAFARKFLAFHGKAPAGRIHVQRTIPAHVGLGSGTQLALAVARGLAAIHGLPADAASLVRAVGRGARSGVGSWTFERGGLVLDGGRPSAGGQEPGLAPLLARHPVPEEWRCVLALPPLGAGPSGDRERDAFARLPPPPREVVWRISHLVLMGVLPALVEHNLGAFGRALSELQRLVGGCFAPVQGGTYASAEVAELVRRFEEAGAAGAGQSSWGPTVYVLVESEDAARDLAARSEGWMGRGGRALVTAFDNRGARVSPVRSAEPGPEA